MAQVLSRRFKIAIAAGALAGATIALGFGPLVRHEANEVAARYGASIAIDGVRPGLRGVRLTGVDVTLPEIPSAKLHLDNVEITYDGEGRSVVVRGGSIAATGSRETIAREVDQWRAHHLGGDQQKAGGKGSRARVEGVDVTWRSGSGEELRATGVSVARDEGKLHVEAGAASMVTGKTNVKIERGAVDLVRDDKGYRIATLTAESAVADIASLAGDAHPNAGAGNDAANEPRRRSKTDSIRAGLFAAAHAIDAALAPSAKVRVAGVRARLHHVGDALNLGPGRLEVARVEDALVVSLVPELDAKEAPSEGRPQSEALTMKLTIPLGAAREVTAEVRGGPIWLSALGVKEGDFGLFNVAETAISTRSVVTLSADGKTLAIDGEGRVRALAVKSEAISDEPVSGVDLAFRVKGEMALDGSRVAIKQGEVDLGAARLLVQGDYERVKDGHRIRGNFDVPITACQSVLDATPRGLAPKLQGLRVAGSFALRGRADIDTRDLDKRFVLDWDTTNSCRFTEAPPDINVERFKKPFRHTVYDTSNRPTTLETGPGSPAWTPLGGISKFMEAAVLTTEDGGFHRHHGFDHEAIKNSIRENLRKKKFVRGASTLSMQLAKNLYLGRTKNIARKLQEAVFTMYLEQELTKEQILELYLNVVEFGPMVYGAGAAARHYFSTSPHELSLSQALYLSSILPNPKQSHFGSGGAVSANWGSYLRKLMKIARDRGRITDEELDEGLRETIILGSPAPQRAQKALDVGSADVPPGQDPDLIGP